MFGVTRLEIEFKLTSKLAGLLDLNISAKYSSPKLSFRYSPSRLSTPQAYFVAPPFFFPFPLTGYGVKKLHVLVSPLQPQGPGRLLPHDFLSN